MDPAIYPKSTPHDFEFMTKDLIHFRGYRDWTVDFFDKKIEELTGYSLDDFLNKRIKWLDLIYEEDKPLALEAVKQALKADKYYAAEYRIVSKEGQIKWITIRGYIVCDEDGDFLSLQGIVNEITPHKRTTQALESVREIFAWIADHVEDGIYIVSEDYRIQFMNKALTDLVGNHVGEICYEALFQRDSVCPWTVMNALKKRACGIQEYHLPGTGKIFEVKSFPITMPDGSTAKMGLLKDVTRRKRLQNEVKELAVRYEAVEDAADKANLGICLLQHHNGLETHIRYANEAFCRIIGYSLNELLERNFVDLIRGDIRQAFLELYHRIQSDEMASKSHELEILRKDGESICVLISPAQSLWDGKPATVLFIRDITERKRVQQALWQSQRLASIGRLAAEVAHEINNPLAVVLTYIKLMRKLIRRQRLTADRLEDVSGYLSTMEEEVSRCGKIVKGLLDFSRREKIDMDENDIHEILDKTLDIIRHRCELMQIQIETSYATDIPPLICDFKRLQQPFLNIFWNAIEAMPNGGVLKVATQFDGKRRLILVTISDTGVGISKEYLERIFEPFFSTKTEGKGVGLGLSVAYGIIRQHYGEISVQSELGKGTRFIIQFPVGGRPSMRDEVLYL